MLLRYYSNWILSLFIIWYLGYLCKLPIINYFNPYYSLLVICSGYTLLMIYLLYYKHYTFQTSYFVSLSLLHYTPLLIMYYLHKKKSFNSNISIITLVTTFLIYTLYLAYLHTDIYTVYLIDSHSKSW